MSLQNTDLLLIERLGVKYKMTAATLAEFIGAPAQLSVNTIAERNALTGLKAGDHIFVAIPQTGPGAGLVSHVLDTPQNVTAGDLHMIVDGSAINIEGLDDTQIEAALVAEGVNLVANSTIIGAGPGGISIEFDLTSGLSSFYLSHPDVDGAVSTPSFAHVALGDSTVTEGWAIYRVQGVTPLTFYKVKEQESLDLKIIATVDLGVSVGAAAITITNTSGNDAVIPAATSTTAGAATPTMVQNSHVKAVAGGTAATNPITVDDTSQAVDMSISQLAILP